MAKRNKAKFATKSRKSALRVEALEQRQLLAAVTGGGTEVGSNIVHPNGNVYDQVLMTGASVTVTADAGQVTRVSFLDLSGDIVQAEFSGAGSLTISLDQFKAAAEATTYNQPGVKYVQGLASFTIQGENSTTNFSAFSVGSGNAINQTLFSGGKTGGNHLADVARLLIVADPAAPGGSTMGGIRMGNVVFADTSGVVGISAANVQTQGPVIIGDIDAGNAGVPTLKFGANSQFATLTIAGGDLVQTNGQTFVGNISGFTSINSQAGADSTVESRPGFTAGTANLGSKVINGATVGGLTVVTLDAITAFDLTGKTQSDIDAAFKGRTFTNDVTISGDLSGVSTLNAAEFRGALSFSGTLSGTVAVTGAVKSITLSKASTAAISADSIGSLTTVGTAADLGGSVKAKSIGNVTVGGALTGTLSTDVVSANNAWNDGEKAIGNVAIAGNASGTIYGVLGVGNVSVGGSLTSTDFIHTSSGTSGDAFLGNVGTVTVEGDTNQAGSLINIANNGSFGAITLKGASTTDTAAHTIGSITVGGNLGAAGTSTGAISITDDAAIVGGAISIGGTTANNGSLGTLSIKSTAGNITGGTIAFTGTGSIGDIALTGSGVKNSVASLGAITATTGSVGTTLGNVSITNAESTQIAGAITAKNVGNLTLTSLDLGGNRNAKISGAITATNGSTTSTIGNISLTTPNGTVTIGGDITANSTAATDTSSIGTVTLSGSTVTWNNTLTAAKIGAVTSTGNLTFADGKGLSALAGITSFTSTGNTTFNSTASLLPNIRTGGTTGMPLTITGTTTFTSNAATIAPSIVANNGLSGLDALGALTFNGKIVGNTAAATAGTVAIRASSIGDITVTGALATNEALVSNFSVYAGNNSGGNKTVAEGVAVAGTNLSSFAIGNISVTSTNTIGIAGTALFSGVNSFQAVGKIGNVSVAAGGSASVQSTLFKSTADSLVVQVGSGALGSSAVTSSAAALTASGIDFDGNGVIGNTGATGTSNDSTITGAIETGTTLSTSATVSIGTVTINAARASSTLIDTIGAVGGTAGGYSDGLFVLSGTKGSGTIAAGTVTGGDFRIGTTQDVTAVNANMRGTIGNITVVNLSQQLSVQTSPTQTNSGWANITDITTPEASGLFAATRAPAPRRRMGR